MEIVIAVAAKIAEYTVRPVGRWLSYSCHYKSNMDNLKELEKTLRDAKKEVERKVKTASDNGDEIKDNVETWLKKVDDIIKKLGGGEEEAESTNSNPSCLNLKQRHQMSREAKQMVGNIAELLENGNFVGGVSHRPAAQDRVTPRNKDYMTLDSRISITKRIMKALGDANINKIGVWGSPGVGKSTLMKEIFRKAKEESLFDEVALANVTDSPNLSRIQEEIADMLDLKLDPNCKTEMLRAGHLRARLEKDKEKKILVILDDIWKQLDLEEIGITPSERCKVLLTSRDRHVLASEMGTKENSFKLDILGQEEAWNLFEEMVGDSVKDDLDLRNAAIEVAKACGGLPIALVTVSRALKDKRLSVWKDALVQLTRPTPEHDTEIWLKSVYSCIELSYKHLVGRALKSLFLLCARQGYYISYRDLLRYGFGLCLCGIDTLDEARNRLENLVSKLQDACLLLQSPRSSEEFYMHDVVCHVATIIASNDDHNMFVMRGDGGQKVWPDVDALKRCEALSIHGGDHIHKYPNKIECPKLRYFHVQCNLNPMFKTPSSTSFQGMDKLEDIFFQGMEKLEVLSLTNIQLSSLLPLTNLQTLCLDGCKLGDIHWIGELKTLVILSLACSDISNLPGEIGSLTGLRLLDLSDCFQLRVIPPNVLSSLVNLEELYMRNIKVQWEVEGPNNEGKNASLAELKKLSHLITLEIEIPNAKNLPKDFFPEKLERYKIRIGDSQVLYLIFSKAAISRTLELKLNMSSFQLDFGIKMLLKSTENLYLDESNSTKSVFYELDREDFQQLKHLHIQNGNIKHIPELRTPAVAFPILETFVLKDMISLEEICQGNLPLTSFKNLKVLKVENCEKLRFIFSSSIARGLSLLEELKIRSCKNVGAIFVKEEEEGIEEAGDMMLFRRLQTLELIDLPKLVSFLNTRETNSEGNDHDLQVPLLHHQLSFHSLKNLYLQRLPKIKHVWSNVNGCESLKSLQIEDCGVMEDIVAREDGTDPTTRLLFPSLTLLRLDGLPKLKWFFQGVRTLESSSSKQLHEQGGTLFRIEEVAFPNLTNLKLCGLHKIKHVWNMDPQTILRFQNLQKISVKGCASLKSLFPASVSGCLKQLTEIEINDCGVLEEIVGAEEGEAVGRMLVFEFPQVTSLDLANLPRLECFYRGVHISKWPMLKTMSIEECEKVEVFASGLMNFEETVEERQYSQMSIKQPFFLVDEMPFPSLEVLKISKMEKLEIIWNIKDSHQRYMYSFPNLLDIEVGHCESLKSLFPASVGGCLKQLKKIKIDDCGVEEIVGAEGGEAMGRTLVFEFPQLTSLDLAKLPRLECFYRGVHISKWPMLETMSIQECEKVEVFASGLMSFEKTVEERQYSQMSIKQPLFLVDELSFSSLKKLHFQDMDKLEIIWQDQVAASSFSKNIQDVLIQNCEKLLHVFQSNLITTTILTQSLTRLCIWDCSSLETIFRNMEGHNGKELQLLIAPSSGMEESAAREDGTARHIVFPILTEMTLVRLPKLKWILEGVHTNLECPSLEILRLSKCEQVILASKFASTSSSQETSQQNKLQTCIQLALPNQLEFELGICQVKLPSTSFIKLRVLVLENCEKLRFVFSSSIARGLSLLEELEIRRCNNMGAIVVKEENDGIEDGDVVLFHQLQTLVLEDLPELMSFQSTRSSFMTDCGQIIAEGNRDLHMPLLHHQGKLPSTSFKKLRVLKLENCEKLRFVFSSSIARGLSLFEELEIKRCNNMGAIVVKEEKDEIEDGDVVLFHQLQTLVLEDLPELVSFLSARSSFMTDCGQIIAEGNPDLHMPLLDHQGKLPSTSFKKLRVLKLENCEKLRFVFSSSIARGLSLFEELEIKRCNNMGAIVVKEEKDEIEDGDVVLFHQLQTLVLEDLPELVSFLSARSSFMTDCGQIIAEGNRDLHMPLLDHQVSFPSLWTLRMKGLPKIKHVWNCGQEPKTVFRCLEQLKILEIEDCGVEEIVAGGGEPVARTILEFPRVTVLRLKNLKRLKWFYKGVHVTKWPMLEIIWIEGCEKVEIFSSGVVSFEEKVEKRPSEMSIKQPLFLVDELSFSSLKTLYICDMDKLEIICQDQVAASSFSKNIQDMLIRGCEKLLHVFQSNVLMQSLTCLCIWDCSSLETIFRNMEGHNGKEPQVLIAPSSGMEESGAREDGTARHIEFPILTEMSLARLPKLKWILECPSLEKLELSECDQVIWASIFASSSSSQETSQQNQLQTCIQLQLPNLLELELGICQVKLPSTSFKKLRVLVLENCEKLRFVFSSSIARGLSLLEGLQIRRCNNMGAIVVEEEKYGIEDGDVILFQQLQILVLEDLPELVSFLSTSSSFMTDCGQIIAKGNRDLHMPLLHHQVKLPSTSFKKLRVLKLENCEKLRFVFSSSIARGLSLFKELKIKRCNNMGAIVVKEEKDEIEDGDVVLFHQLQVLVLEDLPELVSFLSARSSFMTNCGQIIAEGNRDLHMPLLHHQVSFPSLWTLRMKGLPKIKHVWNCGQEPKTVFRCLEQLKILEIEDCGVEEIVASGGEPVARTILEFPRVTVLRLKNLKRLKWFYKGVHVTKWPMLEIIWIEGCEKVEIFASGVVSFEEIVEKRPSEMSIKQPLFLVDELSFSSLNTLHIHFMDKLEIICQDQVAASSFSKNIQHMNISRCEKLLHFFQSNVLMQSLTRLRIWDCSSLETIFRNMEGHNGKAPQVLIAPSSGTEESVAREDGTARHIEFPILTEMTLYRLPKLKWILEGVHTNLECPSLEILQLEECEQVILASKFASSNSSQETSQQNQLQTCIQLQLPNLLELQVWYSGREEIFPYEVVDPVPRLRRLELFGLRMLTHLWKEDSTQPCPLFHNLEFLHLSQCGKLKNIVPSSVFLQNLTELHISYCDGLINLLTSSTAETLVQLQKMTLTKCERITEIVAVEDGKANVAITFNKLAYLELEDLPNLTHFCSGPYSIGFPSLDKPIVTRCPRMKTFCDGLSSTPELEFEFALEA